MRILLVDDDELFRRVMMRALTNCGHEVSGAQDGFDGLDCVRSGSPQLVIADIEMPRMNGLTMLDHLKKSNPRLPVILTTARGGCAGSSDAFEAGAYGYLEKPMRVDALLAGIRRLEGATG